MGSPEHYPDDLLYDSEHDWARVGGEEAVFGITWYAQEQLGEIVFCEGAKVGEAVVRGESYSELESVKAVSEVIAPLSGVVLAVNEGVVQEPETVNRSPYDDGWLVRVRLSAPREIADLLAPAAYKELLGR